jgi:GcrA cell cycle regulator
MTAEIPTRQHEATSRFWTEAELQTLRTSWAAGLTCREIAAKLPGRSRTAVAGMSYRMALPMRNPQKATRLLKGVLRNGQAAPPRPASRGVVMRDYVPARITLAGPAWSHGGGL